ncbi:MAG: exodeoxyribonuclease VII small subunit [bacterium]
MARKTEKKEPGFEEVLAELETLVGRLEADELSLDDALALYGRGVELARQGTGMLEGAERRIEELKASLEEDA